MASTTRRSSHSGSSSTREYLVIIQPDEGRRFKLNLKGEVRHLTLAKVKQCLATASSCSIPQTMMELKLNGIPLHEDGDLCGSLGISSGTALTLQRTEAPKASSGGAANAARVYSTPDDLLTSSSAPQQPVAGPLAAPHPDALLSPPRHQIELQTLQEQQWYLLKDQRAREEVMQQTMHHMEDQLQQAAHQRMMLEKHRRLAQDGILRLQQREAEAMREKEKLEWLQAEEAKRAAQRAEDLSARREQLRAEQEAIRSVALQTLELEQRKEMLAKQKVAYEVEQERVRRVQASFEAEAKARAMQLKAKEVDIEQARLASAQQERELQEEQDRAARQMEYYYDNHGEAMAGSFVDSAEAPRGTSINSSGLKSRPFNAQQYFTNTPAAKAPGGAPLRGGAGARSTSRPATARGAASPRGPTVDPRTPHDALVLPDGGYYSPRENAEENLRRLGEDLGMAETLRFDEQNTCVISVDGEYTLLITFDADTERIFLYSTLLTALPADDPFLRLRLYDFLMEGALLGREMCGGGIGASLRNDFVLMSTSIYMPTSQPWSLRTTAPQFVQSLHHWRIRVNDFLAQETENRLGMRADGGTATAGAAAMASPPVVGHRPRGSTAATTPHAEAGKGSRSSPVIGLEVVDTLLLNGSAARYRDGGVLIVGVSGPSAASGVLPHDVLKKINHITINDAAIFQEACRSLVPGEVAKLTIERNGLESVLAIQVGASAVYDLPR